MQDQFESCASPDAFVGSQKSFVDLARKAAKALGYVWLAGASITWMLCPSPAPVPASLSTKVHYADEAAYYIECLSLWPAIAYFTLEHPPG